MHKSQNTDNHYFISSQILPNPTGQDTEELPGGSLIAL